jgi:hypothetical protein
MLRLLLAAVFVGTAACAAPESLPVDARDGDSSRTDIDSMPDHGEAGDTAGDADARDDGLPDDAAADADADADSRDDGPRDDGWGDDGSPDDAARDDAARDDAARDDAAPDAGSLDPDLELPDPSGAPCSTPGSMTECPGIEVCRFFTPAEGRCESCEPCGNLGDYCTRSSECDILFMCYAGACTNICPLGTMYCGPVEDCLDIGHPTYGVCRP